MNWDLIISVWMMVLTFVSVFAVGFFILEKMTINFRQCDEQNDTYIINSPVFQNITCGELRAINVSESVGVFSP